jgi:hypothetical protein
MKSHASERCLINTTLALDTDFPHKILKNLLTGSHLLLTLRAQQLSAGLGCVYTMAALNSVISPDTVPHI